MVKRRPASRKGLTKLTPSSRKAARRRRHPSRLPPPEETPHPALRLAWRPRKSARENLSSFGLQHSVNNLSKSRFSVSRTLSAPPPPPPPPSDARGHVLDALVAAAAVPERRGKSVHVVRPGETVALRRLVHKYGDDYHRMANDLKLNYLQLTEHKLKNKIARMNRLLAL